MARRDPMSGVEVVKKPSRRGRQPLGSVEATAELAGIFKDLRQKAGLSLAQAAPLAGMSKSEAHKVEIGARSMRPEHVIALCRAYGANPLDVVPATSPIRAGVEVLVAFPGKKGDETPKAAPAQARTPVAKTGAAEPGVIQPTAGTKTDAKPAKPVRDRAVKRNEARTEPAAAPVGQPSAAPSPSTPAHTPSATASASPVGTQATPLVETQNTAEAPSPVAAAAPRRAVLALSFNEEPKEPPPAPERRLDVFPAAEINIRSSVVGTVLLPSFAKDAIDPFAVAIDNDLNLPFFPSDTIIFVDGGRQSTVGGIGIVTIDEETAVVTLRGGPAGGYYVETTDRRRLAVSEEDLLAIPKVLGIWLDPAAISHDIE